MAAEKRPGRTTIVVMPDVRDSLKHIARKDQDYNDLLKDLIQLFQRSNVKVAGDPTRGLQARPQNDDHDNNAHTRSKGVER